MRLDRWSFVTLVGAVFILIAIGDWLERHYNAETALLPEWVLRWLLLLPCYGALIVVIEALRNLTAHRPTPPGATNG